MVYKHYNYYNAFFIASGVSGSVWAHGRYMIIAFCRQWNYSYDSMAVAAWDTIIDRVM